MRKFPLTRAHLTPASVDIDTEPSPEARAAAEELISAELPHDYQTTLHPAVPALPEFRFSDLIEQELSRVEAGQPMSGGVDLSRYEAPEAPAEKSTTAEEASRALPKWKEALQKAYASSSHLSMRHANLTLLEENGKNAWLIGNSQLEEILRGLERELAETNEAVDNVNKERKLAQLSGQAELVGLEETWRRSVGAALDVEVAAESLRMQILERRRQAAQQNVR